MCFINDDCDWVARSVEEGDPIAEKPTRCNECHATIPIGGTVHTLHMEEWEECHRCEEGECACPKNKYGCCLECQCSEPDFGQTNDWQCCHDCFRFLQAVQEAEQEAGCDYRDSRPSLGTMTEEISEAGRDEARKYFRTAARLYPDLKTSGYLGQLWKKMFG